MTDSRYAWLGSVARGVERLLARSPLRAPSLVIEASTAALSGLFTAVGHPLAEGVEGRVRGILHAPRWKTIGLRLGKGVLFRGGGGKIRLGRNVVLNDYVFIGATGPRGSLRIGDDTHVDVGSVLYAEGGLGIGVGCAIASGVVVYTQTNQYRADPAQPIRQQRTVYQSVSIGDDVWIGARAVILPGVKLGDHAVIGAGSVVTQNVPSWAVAAGVPARVIRDRRDSG